MCDLIVAGCRDFTSGYAELQPASSSSILSAVWILFSSRRQTYRRINRQTGARPAAAGWFVSGCLFLFCISHLSLLQCLCVHVRVHAHVHVLPCLCLCLLYVDADADWVSRSDGCCWIFAFYPHNIYVIFRSCLEMKTETFSFNSIFQVQ